ncbi:cell wall hydrolase [Xanthomonas phage RTH11]|nr:cell wall hydrolase [Xanthomonas phage RTH11]
MFNFNVKTFLIVLFALTLTACATISKPAFLQKADPILIASSVPVFAPLPVNIEPVELVAAIPEIKDLPIPVVPLNERARVVLSEAEITCMAKAVYFEARGEGTVGMTAVGYVILNRMAHHDFKAKTACGVVYERNSRGCQFSWVCDGKPDAIRSAQTYEIARKVAVDVMNRSVENPIDDSLFFRHRAAKVKFAYKFRATIGAHRFYAKI